ncbi:MULTISPECIES: HAMP domain-containing sensor histidine kinase [Streptomyces]|uniref:histidine kinase n=1 Tax=Streptomyces venezuelae TaxID=54571 RepID=A0A5P2BGM1_STRVZ|nr:MULTISPECIES: HAMP domain-containing sensor histidine kinase [Streptomyces]MYY84248.1 HAMP domain-containing protein [Streptomyces sp. SID335]MYZ19054.1 HAMP domain-containing protein [Streptomyces sp. SID337]NDZ84567.1 HAMP domain-containing histidine kinase [Streptomyces sp. SID10115]NEB50496.1 HAMP domain-containing histidine kinase [Streptomyces sp. SID339]QES29526.1 two-component sensor histidine kinase [Streptomyces venezuelae]
MSRLFGSVRARATLGASLVVALALVAAGAAVLLSLRDNLTDQAGSRADSAARKVASQLLTVRSLGDLDLPDDENQPVQVVDGDGRLVAASEDLQRISGTGVDQVKPGRGGAGVKGDSGDAGDREDGEIDDETEYTDGSATIDGESGEYRFAAVEVSSPKGDFTVHAGGSLSDEQSAVSTALTSMLIGFPLLLAVVAGVTWLVTRRALRPVAAITAEMSAITASEDLARRVPEPDTHDEIARLARTTNETLTALQTSVERQRRFVADASHELRSPIASLRTQLEVGAAHPELLDVDGAVEDTVRLQELAADLLLLARLDAGEKPGAGRVDLAAFAREELSQRTRDHVEVHADLKSAEVAGSRGQLARVLGNLLNNAQRHARSRVTVTTRSDGAWAVLEVADDGSGVPEGERERIFERFVRLDDARTRDEGGAGLGLAIARDVAVRHGGTLVVREAPSGGALFELRLPSPQSSAE